MGFVIGGDLAHRFADRIDNAGLTNERRIHLEEAVVHRLVMFVKQHLDGAEALIDGIEQGPVALLGFAQRLLRSAALDQVGLRGRESHAPITLSTGEQQRVGIARAVAPRPDVLIADEPTGNLDPELSLEIMELFTRFNEVGVTLLIATHDLELVEQLPHRTLRLVAGQIAGDTRREG